MSSASAALGLSGVARVSGYLSSCLAKLSALCPPTSSLAPGPSPASSLASTGGQCLDHPSPLSDHSLLAMGSGGTRGNQRDEARAKNLKNAPKQTQARACSVSCEHLTHACRRTTRTGLPSRSARSATRRLVRAVLQNATRNPLSPRATHAVAEKAAKKAAEKAAAT
jgi:hypothetical protein